MILRRAKNEKGQEKAREALHEAQKELKQTQERWHLIRAISRRAESVAGEAREQVITNHLGDVFAQAIRESGRT